LRASAQDEPPTQPSVFDFSLYGRQGVSRVSSSWARETEVRLMANIRARSWLQVEAHNETFYQAGSARRPTFELANAAHFPSLDGDRLMDDSRRLFDLSWVVARSADHLVVNRFDRLSVTAAFGRSRVKLGRQVVTWGNGLLFNPFDLFSPYAPTEIDRDYKRGEDGASWSVDAGEKLGDFEAVSLFKRDATTGKAGTRQASFGVKHHRLIGSGQWETTAIVGKHFGETIVGGGIVGRVGDVVGRSEWVHTKLADGAGSAWTGIANVDVAWVWKGMNSHAGAEYYFSSLGGSDATDLHSPRGRALRARLARGELFVQGRHYLDGVFNVEPHPLVGVALNTILNLSDKSGVVQPSLTWDASSRIQGRVTATFMWGKRGSEFHQMPNRIDVRVTTTF
jgi:hypothetical protein